LAGTGITVVEALRSEHPANEVNAVSDADYVQGLAKHGIVKLPGPAVPIKRIERPSGFRRWK